MTRNALLAATAVLAGVAGYFIGAEADDGALDAGIVAAAQQLIGLEFTPAECDSMLDDLGDYRESYATMRGVTIENAVPPALVFDPFAMGGGVAGEDRPIQASQHDGAERPADLEKVAFYSVGQLAELVRRREVTSEELTRMYLGRLKEHGDRLECVITITEELAIEQARRADAEIAAGKYRGPLHGIPYGAKDLLSVAGYKTTWGAEPFKNQMIEENAAVIAKLEAAGAVLVAKLTLGALAWGDVWYGGKTRNPWNLEQGSSGSSAGSASATAAGLVAFAIGTETWGSIVSPSTRCGTTGLRPTFGTVSRTGAMALSWSMDKIGPICRTVEDCALVFDAIRGPDGKDPSVVEAPFNYDVSTGTEGIRVGYVKTLFEADYGFKDTDAATLDRLRELGIELIPIELPDLPVGALTHILTAEAAAAFDELTRSNRDDMLVRQIKNAWPNVFRAARFIPAVEYIQANRLRYLVMQAMEQLPVDVYVVPSFGGDNLLMTNLTGHPCVVLPNGFSEEGSPVSITFVGKLFGEAEVLRIAQVYQDATEFHLAHPETFR